VSYPYSQATAPQVRRGPHLAWLWLGIAMAVLAAVSVIAYVSMNIRGLDAGSEFPETGPGEVTLPLYEGHSYGVYLPADDWAPISTLACTVSQQAPPVSLDLEEWDGGLTGGEYEDFGRQWVVAGRFQSPVDGLATVTCEGAASGLLLYPDDKAFMVLFAVVVAAGVVGLGGTALAITVGVTRGGRRRENTSASWGGAYAPYPGSPYRGSPYPGSPYPPTGYPGAPPDPYGAAPWPPPSGPETR
jgi:hypothetical protein